jgi:hypothetical protein
VEAVATMRRSSGALLNADLEVATARAAARGCSGKALGEAARAAAPVGLMERRWSATRGGGQQRPSRWSWAGLSPRIAPARLQILPMG